MYVRHHNIYIYVVHTCSSFAVPQTWASVPLKFQQGAQVLMTHQVQDLDHTLFPSTSHHSMTLYNVDNITERVMPHSLSSLEAHDKAAITLWPVNLTLVTGRPYNLLSLNCTLA